MGGTLVRIGVPRLHYNAFISAIPHMVFTPIILGLNAARRSY